MCPNVPLINSNKKWYTIIIELINFTKNNFHFDIFLMNPSLLFKKHTFSRSLWSKQDNIGQDSLKGSRINNKTHISLSNSLWTSYFKGTDKTIYRISFQQLTTDSSNITVSLRIKPQLIQQLLNNTLQGTGQEYLNHI